MVAPGLQLPELIEMKINIIDNTTAKTKAFFIIPLLLLIFEAIHSAKGSKFDFAI